jgi:hypothetical protein
MTIQKLSLTNHATAIGIIAFKPEASVSIKQKQSSLKYSFSTAISVQFWGIAIMYDAFFDEYKRYNQQILNGMTQQISRHKWIRLSQVSSFLLNLFVDLNHSLSFANIID